MNGFSDGFTESLERMARLEHENYILNVQIQAKDEMLQLFYQEQSILFFSLNYETQTVEYIVGAGLERFNERPVNLLGKSVFELAKQNEEAVSILNKAFQGDEFQTHFQLSPEVTYKVSFRPERDKENHIIRIFGLAIDLS